MTFIPLKRKYVLNEVNDTRAREAGLVDAEWYRSPIALRMPGAPSEATQSGSPRPLARDAPLPARRQRVILSNSDTVDSQLTWLEVDDTLIDGTDVVCRWIPADVARSVPRFSP
jgi:hypothetical protein